MLLDCCRTARINSQIHKKSSSIIIAAAEKSSRFATGHPTPEGMVLAVPAGVIGP